MLLTPRYDGPPIIAIEVRDAGPHPVVQQRRRLEALLGDLSDDEWAHPSRCDAWTVQDVITHLVSTNHFWSLSIAQALAGEPTRFLASFDPVASPAELVDSTRGTPAADTLEAFRSSNHDLLEAVEALDEAGWEAVGEAPPGHVPLTLVADHALWDCWVHERDVVAPARADAGGRSRRGAHVPPVRGRPGSGLRGRPGGSRWGSRGARGHRSGARASWSPPAATRFGSTTARRPADAPVVTIAGVPLLEMLSRRDAGQPVPDVVEWLSAGLATVFDESEPSASQPAS